VKRLGDVDVKAVRYVTAGHVTIIDMTHTDGIITSVTGTVEGDSGLWQVEVTPDATTCTCPYGTLRVDAGGHSHDLALRLAAQRILEHGMVTT